jgi:acyl-CoA synthetase (NDP forming)
MIPASRQAAADYRQHRLHRLLTPRSIAVVGVSARRRNIGAIVMANIQATGFRGRVVGGGPRARRRR